MKKIDFNIELKDAFGEVAKEGKDNKAVILSRALVNMISHPNAIPEGTALDGEAILKRLQLQQKIAEKGEKEYGTDELSTIRDTVVNLFNKKMVTVEMAGAILEITK